MTAVRRRRRSGAARGSGAARARRPPAAASLPAWGVVLAIGVAVTVFAVVLAAVDGPLSNLDRLVNDAGALLQPGAPEAAAPDERLVPRRLAPGADVAPVPSVVGLDAAAAAARLDQAGFPLQREEAFDAAVAAGLVVRQAPPAGTEHPRLEPVTVVVSRGPPLAPLPGVTGLTADDARARLDAQGFQVVEVTAFSEDVPAGTVLGQEPLAGAVVDRRSVVVLRISRGAETTVVPPLVGRAEDDARRAVELAGLKVGEVEYRERGGVPNGAVEAQTPASGASAPRGSEVQLTVVRVGEAVVPPLIGLALDAAERDLLDHGLLIGSLRLAPTADAAPGVVIGQEPGPGASVPRGFGMRLIAAAAPAAPAPAPPAPSG